MMKSVAEVFFQDFLEQMDALKLSVKNNDVTQVVNILHQMKGASANVGAKALSALVFEMELKAKAGKIDEIQCNFGELEKSFRILKAAMQQKL